MIFKLLTYFRISVEPRLEERVLQRVVLCLYSQWGRVETPP